MALKSFGPTIYDSLAKAMAETFSGLNTTELTVRGVGTIMQDWALVLVKTALPVTGVLVGIAVAVGLAQSRLAISFKPLMPDFNRINPVQGFTRIFSMRTLVELVKSLLKLGIIGFIAYHDVSAVLPKLPDFMRQNVALGVTTIAGTAVTGLQHIGMGLLALGVADYGYQYWDFNRNLRMTKQEAKQEHKEQEGNPELKQKQRQKARELARRRKALKDVPMADVIITNPTHYAIAIKYEAGEDAAPRVVAKGVDLLAQRIKVIAKQNEVPMVENRPLARTLYASVDVGKTVPPELYQAVAEVLAFVYNLRREQRRRR